MDPLLRRILERLIQIEQVVGGSAIPALPLVQALWSPFTDIVVAVNGATPAVALGQYKFAVDSTNAPANVQLALAYPDRTLLIFSDVAGKSAVNPINVTPTTPGGVLIWDPSTAAFAATAHLESASGGAWWFQYRAATNKWIQVA